MSGQTLKRKDAVTATHDAPARLSGGWLYFARVGWVILAVTAVGIIVAAFPGYAAKFSGQLGHATGNELPPGAHFFATASGVASFVSALLSIGLSTLFFRRKFTEPIAVLLSFFLLIYGVVMAGPLEFASWAWFGSADTAFALQSVLLATPLIALLMLFPNGQFVPGWTHWAVVLSIPWNILLLQMVPFDANSFSSKPVLSVIVSVLFIGFTLVGVYAQIYRYRHISTTGERQQTRWVIFGFTVWLVYIFIFTIPYLYLTGLPADAPTPWWGPTSELAWWLSLNILPVCFTIAITRYQLWQIDVVVNRTLVYGALTAVIVTFYILVVGSLGLLFRSSNSMLITLLATGLAAVLFQPARQRLQSMVNRMMYGERDDPITVLSKLGEQLEKTGPVETILTRIVETVAQTLKLPYTAVTIHCRGTFETAEAYGKPTQTLKTYPLAYQGETVGQLLVAQRAVDEPFSEADERILQNVARQAGTAVHAVQLMADLQQSRQQIISSREEERRRIRRDLHDGLGPVLASLALQADTARDLVHTDPVEAEELLVDITMQAKTAVEDIRRLVYDLRPPALDELGLIEAIKTHVAYIDPQKLNILFELPESLPPLPAAVEVAAYRITQEAINNVLHHAQATTCIIRFWLDGDFHLEVWDDGLGLSQQRHGGLGLMSMRERAAELSGRCTITTNLEGGTCVEAQLPLGEVIK